MTAVRWILLIAAILFPPAWPVLGGVGFYMGLKALQRRDARQRATWAASQPPQIPSQIGAL